VESRRPARISTGESQRAQAARGLETLTTAVID
jgi:hypothetical protein